jgi:hypothetical protein
MYSDAKIMTEKASKMSTAVVEILERERERKGKCASEWKVH